MCIMTQPLIYQRQGAESALIALANHFGSSLFASLPQLWTNITQPLSNVPPAPPKDQGIQLH